MTVFAAVVIAAFVAVFFVAFEAWQESEQAIRRVREEFSREPAPWWVPRD